MARRLLLAVTPLACLMLFAASSGSSDTTGVKDTHGGFTGEVKVVFYVTDVREAVAFYAGALGFTFHNFYDHVSGGSVHDWAHEEAPIYAEMSYAGHRFGLHAPVSEADERSVGAAKTYFRVEDLDAHHRRAEAYGADPGEIVFAFSDDETQGNPWYGE
jgi:predicted enzyme related to lactoylglutathione lyase